MKVKALRIIKDLTGKTFGKLLVIDIEYQCNGYTYYKCKCECGKTKVIRGTNLVSGKTQSCGCLKVESGKDRRDHGLSQTPLYYVWSSMKSRCNNINNKRYKNYGARGIKVCHEWNDDFYSFYKWAIENGYKNGVSIDRIDVNDNYAPDNCRWIKLKEQNRNKTNNRIVKYKGKERLLVDLAKQFNISSSYLAYHLEKNEDIEDIINKSNRHIRVDSSIEYNTLKDKVEMFVNINNSLKIIDKQNLVVALNEVVPRSIILESMKISTSTLNRWKNKEIIL